MKTETGLPLMALVLVLAGVIAFAVWSASAADAAALQVRAAAIGNQMPEATLIMSEVAGWALRAVLGIIVVAIASGLAYWMRSNWRQWLRGDDKRRARQQQVAGYERGPRQMSEAELMRMILMQQLGTPQQRGARMRPTQPMPDNDDDDLPTF